MVDNGSDEGKQWLQLQQLQAMMMIFEANLKDHF